MRHDSPYEPKAQTGHFKYWDILKSESQEHRNNPTLAENKLWQALLHKNTCYEFHRQKPVGRFILDFYCTELLLAIEVDGSSHVNKQKYDCERDNYLKNCGILTISYLNIDIMKNFTKTKEDIMRRISERAMDL